MLHVNGSFVVYVCVRSQNKCLQQPRKIEYVWGLNGRRRSSRLCGNRTQKGNVTTLSFTGCVLLMVSGVSKVEVLPQRFTGARTYAARSAKKKERGGATP